MDHRVNPPKFDRTLRTPNLRPAFLGCGCFGTAALESMGCAFFNGSRWVLHMEA